MLGFVRSRIRKIRQLISRVEVEAVRFTLGTRPVSFRLWRARERVLNRIVPVVNPGRPAPTAERNVLTAELREVVQDLPVTGFALGTRAFVYIAEEFRRERPRVVVEFGSGTSTIVLGHLASTATWEPRPFVLSLEQDREGAERVRRALLDRAITGTEVRHVTLDEHDAFDPAGLADALGELGRPIDWVMIDGPFGRPGCREGTLPAVIASCADGARWFLDDALRSAEMGILRRWSERSGPVRVTVDGIIPIGQGIATGRVWR